MSVDSREIIGSGHSESVGVYFGTAFNQRTLGMETKFNGCFYDVISDFGVDNVPARQTGLSDLLIRFADEQVPAAELVEKCRSVAVDAVSILQKEMCSSFLGCVMVTGSYGKTTALAHLSDYDIVVFFKDMEPPFTGILLTMEAALKKHSYLLQNFKWIFRSAIHICIEVDSIRLDITPATLVEENCSWKDWTFVDSFSLLSFPTEQYVKVLEKIALLSDPTSEGYFYSSSLSIEAVLFVQRQTPFVHCVIRLAKLWACHLNTGKIFIRGKSVLMETLAIHACYSLNATEMARGNVEKAFKKFLAYFADARNLRLYFVVNYVKECIPESILNETPLVLDPVNPFNNLLSPANFPPTIIKSFETAAKIMLERLETFKSNETDMGGRDELELLKCLFQY